MVCYRNPYPIVLLHQDLTEEDMASFRAVSLLQRAPIRDLNQIQTEWHEILIVAVVLVLQATGATLFFQRVIFDEDTLPSYLDREAFLSWIRPKVRLYIYKKLSYMCLGSLTV